MPKTKIALVQLDVLPAMVLPHTIIEEPSNQSGDTFIVLNHNPAYAFQLYRNGLLLRQSEYTRTPVTGTSNLVIKLLAPLGANDKVQWIKVV